jgi:hypothetical protein
MLQICDLAEPPWASKSSFRFEKLFDMQGLNIYTYKCIFMRHVEAHEAAVDRSTN